jgi:pimeloyl-ACP methyl ester carboxylesterase
VPTAVSIYPGEIYKPPKTWTEKYFNLKQYRVHSSGGHFAPLEQPDIYVNDVRDFFRTLR